MGDKLNMLMFSVPAAGCGVIICGYKEWHLEKRRGEERSLPARGSVAADEVTAAWLGVFLPGMAIYKDM